MDTARRILSVEDDPKDIELTLDALEEHNLTWPLRFRPEKGKA